LNFSWYQTYSSKLIF